MATRRRSKRATSRRKKVSPQLARAKKIIRTMTSRGAQRANLVQAAVQRAGISVRTYRTARKKLGTKAVRISRVKKRRGSGSWHAKAPGR